MASVWRINRRGVRVQADQLSADEDEDEDEDQQQEQQEEEEEEKEEKGERLKGAL